MQQGSEDMNNNKQNQDRRVAKPDQPENQLQQPHQPQKCPRCESLNTKFCYYNNYSLSQPRYFCKTCRRYWTQGGTLRNVPVGGGCRKGKRAKTTSSSSSGDSSRLSQQPPPPPQQQPSPPMVLPSPLPQAVQQNLTNSMMIGSSSVLSSSQFYPPGSGYLSSFAAVQSFNQPTSLAQALLINSGNHHHDADHQLGLGGGSSSSASSSALSLLQGFNNISGASSFGSAQFYPNPSDHHQEGVNVINQTVSARPNSSFHQQDWPHSSFMISNSTTAGASSETAVWNVGNANSNITGNIRRNTTSSDDQPSFNPNQWPHDMPGYGPGTPPS